MRHFADALEFDAWQVGKTLAGMSWRERHVLVTNLPHSSALWRKANPDWEWRVGNAQLADLYDLYAIGAGVTPQGSKKPVTAYRPGDRVKAERDQASRSERARAQKARMKQRGGAGG